MVWHAWETTKSNGCSAIVDNFGLTIRFVPKMPTGIDPDRDRCEVEIKDPLDRLGYHNLGKFVIYSNDKLYPSAATMLAVLKTRARLSNHRTSDLGPKEDAFEAAIEHVLAAVENE